ncbi:hypothetical protein GGR51DRAFT_512111, partial [Nemania sp. FL0031]
MTCLSLYYLFALRCPVREASNLETLYFSRLSITSIFLSNYAFFSFPLQYIHNSFERLLAGRSNRRMNKTAQILTACFVPHAQDQILQG